MTTYSSCGSRPSSCCGRRRPGSRPPDGVCAPIHESVSRSSTSTPYAFSALIAAPSRELMISSAIASSITISSSPRCVVVNRATFTEEAHRRSTRAHTRNRSTRSGCGDGLGAEAQQPAAHTPVIARFAEAEQCHVRRVDRQIPSNGQLHKQLIAMVWLGLCLEGHDGVVGPEPDAVASLLGEPTEQSVS